MKMTINRLEERIMPVARVTPKGTIVFPSDNEMAVTISANGKIQILEEEYVDSETSYYLYPGDTITITF